MRKLKYKTEIIKGAMISVIIGIIIYNSFIAVLCLAPLAFYYSKKCIEKKKEEEKKQKLKEFCDMLEAVQIAIKAGKSVEKAFLQCESSITDIYGENVSILADIDAINNKCRLGLSIEDAIKEFAESTDIPEIYTFADIFSIANRSDGNIVNIIDITVCQIREKFEIEREIKTSLSSVNGELLIMKWMPLVMLLFMRLSSPEYVCVLYEGALARVYMTVILVIYMAVIFWSDRMVKV